MTITYWQLAIIIGVLVIISIFVARGMYRMQMKNRRLCDKLEDAKNTNATLKENLKNYGGQLPLGTVLRLPEDYRVYDLDNPRKVGESWPIISQFVKWSTDTTHYEFTVNELISDGEDIFYKVPVKGKNLYVKKPKEEKK